MRALRAMAALLGGAAFAAQAAPEVMAFELPRLDASRFVTLAEFRDRPVLLNFWRSDCPPCVHEMPLLEAQRVTLLLLSPLDTLLGFEHAPENDAERMRARAAINRLRDGAALFKVDPRARCTFAQVTLDAPLLQLGSAKAETGGHGSLAGTYVFDCADAGQAEAIEVGLFPPFSRMQRIEVQAATPQGQFRRTLERPDGRLTLAR